MRKIFFILASLVAVGCTTTPVAVPPEPVAAIKPVQEVIEPEQETSIFYYYLDSIHPIQFASIVRGNFVWRDRCLYLIGSNRKFISF